MRGDPIPSAPRSRRQIPPLHLLSDDGILARSGFLSLSRNLMDRGRGRLAHHVRGPSTSPRRVFGLAADLGFRARSTGTLLVVNDRVDVALALELAGVQLGGRSLPVADARRLLGPGARIGASVHGPEEARRAEEEGADFLLVGTIYPTASHPGRPGAGPGRIREVAARSDLPLLAVGGITPERVEPVLEAGALGVAVIRGIWEADDPVAALDDYLSRIPESGVPERSFRKKNTEDGS